MPVDERRRASLLERITARLEEAETNDDPDLLMGAEAIQEASELAAISDPAQDLEAAFLLGWFHWSRYLVLPEHEDQEDLDAAIQIFGVVYSRNPGAVPEPVMRHYALLDDGDPDILTFHAFIFLRNYERSGALRDLNEAIGFFRAALAGPMAGPPDRGGRLSNLANTLQLLADRTSDAGLLAEVIQANRDAVAAAADEPARAIYLDNLGGALLRLHEWTGDDEPLTEAIKVAREAVALTPASHTGRADCLNGLGNGLRALFARTGDSGALAEAVQIARDVVDLTPAGHPRHAMYLHNLGNALIDIFERTGDTAALMDSVRTQREAVAATAVSDFDYVSHLTSLGIALSHKFDHTGDSGALIEAAQVHRAAAAAAPTGHPDRAMCLSNLAATLRRSFEETGDTEILAEAAQAAEDAIAATPAGDPGRAARLHNLSGVLQRLSDRTGDTELLIEAGQAAEDAVAATAADHPDRAMYLSSLAGILFAIFRYTNDIDLLAEAIQAQREAVAAEPVGQPYREISLNRLGNMLARLFDSTGDMATMIEAVQVFREAVAAAQKNRPYRAMCLSGLCGALRTLAVQDPVSIEMLTEAVHIGRAAVAATPADHPDYSLRQVVLGNALQSLSGQTGDVQALAEARDLYWRASQNLAAPALSRITAYRQAARVMGRIPGEAPQRELEAMEAAAELLTQVASRQLRRRDREYQLRNLADFAADAAAAAVNAGEAGRAVALLEQTRGILISDTIDARGSDLMRLSQEIPELAEAFHRIRSRILVLDQNESVGDRAGAARDLARERRDADLAWRDLVARIRSRKGFEYFLQPPDVDGLTRQAADGPIVYVYASRARSGALILSKEFPEKIRAVSLPGLNEDDARARTAELVGVQFTATDPDADLQERVAAQARILEILSWLWDAAAAPILEALGYTDTPDPSGGWPRVWWCPVGFLTVLPLHAAGHHQDLADPDRKAQPRTVMDRVISSYATTVRGLSYSRSRHPDITGGAVIVNAPDASGASPLPGAVAEAEALSALIPHARVLADPTREVVLDSLADSLIAHFCCHGQTDWNDPAASSLILVDHETEPLTVADISACQLTASLAYLSACSTTVTDVRLSDEAVHISGAFHLAGYQHVIGTLWPINDLIARDIATGFYDFLTSGGTQAPATGQAPQALHHALHRIRARYPRIPTHWAAHVHAGI